MYNTVYFRICHYFISGCQEKGVPAYCIAVAGSGYGMYFLFITIEGLSRKEGLQADGDFHITVIEIYEESGERL